MSLCRIAAAGLLAALARVGVDVNGPTIGQGRSYGVNGVRAPN